MTTVQSTGVDLTALTPKSTGSGKGMTASENRFLTLLVTQLKNQDPLNPMDNAEMTTQLAQISTVGGIETLNTTLQSLVASYAATQSMQATSMIGQGVLVPGSTLELKDGAATGGAMLDATADKVIVSITDKDGVLVSRIDLGPQAAGAVSFQWDGETEQGTAPAGRYGFAVTATRGETAVNATPLSYGRVTAVAPGASGATLSVGELGSFAFDDVKQVVQ